MTTRKRPSGSSERRRITEIRKLGRLEPFVKGSLVAVVNKKCNHTAHMITFQNEGKTRSIYVPVDMVEEVRRWTRNYRRMKEIAEWVSSLSIGIIRRHVTERKADARRKRRLRT